MTEDLLDLIWQALAAKPKEDFALFYHPGPPLEWAAHIVNPSSHVLLGETQGLWQGRGLSAEEAVSDLLRDLRDNAEREE